MTYYRWRKEFGGLKTDQVRRIKDLEIKYQRFRKAVADLTLDKLILQQVALRAVSHASLRAPNRTAHAVGDALVGTGTGTVIWTRCAAENETRTVSGPGLAARTSSGRRVHR